MKRILTTVSLAIVCAASWAQYQAGDLFLYPRIGVVAANHSDNDVLVNDMGTQLKSKSKAGMTAGIEAELFLTDQLSLSAGLLYANQGFRYADYGTEDKNTMTFWNVEKMKTTMHYVNLPVLANVYITDGLAVKAGAQLGYLLSARSSGKGTTGVIEDGMKYIPTEIEDLSTGCTSQYNRLDLSIPIGVSYEYKRIVLDLRYSFGLTKVAKYYTSSKNSCLSLTLGYQLEL